MNKLVILYASVHHQNTKKVVDYIAARLPGNPQVVDLTKDKSPDITDADGVILASGIYFSKPHKSLTAFMDKAALRGKRAAVVFTCGLCCPGCAGAAGRRLTKRGAVYLGGCHCRGFDTFGPLAKLGGIAKGRPNGRDMERILTALQRLFPADG